MRGSEGAGKAPKKVGTNQWRLKGDSRNCCRLLAVDPENTPTNLSFNYPGFRAIL